MSVALSREALGMNDLPLGAFQDEERRIVVSGHQKAGQVGSAFGLLGVLVAHQVDKSSANSRFGQAIYGSNVDLLALTSQAVAEELAAQPGSGWTMAVNGKLQLRPNALFTILESGKARLHAVLRVEIPGSVVCESAARACLNPPDWLVRYFVQVPGEYPVEGNDGWMAGDRYAEGIRLALRRAVKVCIDDTRGGLTGTRTAKAKGGFPFLPDSGTELPVIIAQESEDSVVARLIIGDAAVLSGTHVLRVNDFVLTPAEFRDPRLPARAPER